MRTFMVDARRIVRRTRAVYALLWRFNKYRLYWTFKCLAGHFTTRNESINPTENPRICSGGRIPTPCVPVLVYRTTIPVQGTRVPTRYVYQVGGESWPVFPDRANERSLFHAMVTRRTRQTMTDRSQNLQKTNHDRYLTEIGSHFPAVLIVSSQTSNDTHTSIATWSYYFQYRVEKLKATFRSRHWEN